MTDRPRHPLVPVLALAAGVFCLAAAPVEAAGRGKRPSVRPAAKTAQVPARKGAASASEAGVVKSASADPTGAWTSGERPCFRGRRKLWQDGEGWVVKKVSVCP